MLFDSTSVHHIFTTLLFSSVQHDRAVWKHEKDGNYYVQSAYCAILDYDESLCQHRTTWNSRIIWQAKMPPKIKNFMWRVGRNCLSTRVRLQTQGVSCAMRNVLFVKSMKIVCTFCSIVTELEILAKDRFLEYYRASDSPEQQYGSGYVHYIAEIE